jgi:hypothetical protein
LQRPVWDGTRPLLVRLTGGRLPVRCGPEHPLAATGLAAQPLPHRPGRSRTRLRPGRATRQRQRRREGAGHDLAVAAHSVHPPRARHAGPPPPGRAPARHRRRPPAHRAAGHARPGPGVCGPQPWRPPRPATVTGRAIPVGPPRRAVRHARRNVVVELYSESHARQPTTRAWAIIRRLTEATGWPANAPAARSAATPTERTHEPAPATPGAGVSGRCPLTFTAQPAGQRGAVPPRCHWVVSRWRTVPRCPSEVRGGLSS